MKIISFVGWSKSGKTAIIEWLVRELKRRELRVVVVKHIHKPIFEVDRKGKDTWRLFNAGADAVMGVSSRRFYLLSRTQNTLPLEKLCGVLEWIYNKVDFILIEGRIPSKHRRPPVVLIVREDREIEEFEKLKEQIVAVVYWEDSVDRKRIARAFKGKYIISVKQKEQLLELLLNLR